MSAQSCLPDDRSYERLYDRRYAEGYMDDWPEHKLQRVRSLLGSLELPESGTVVDYGCGCGVFTALLRDGLPGRQIVGLDISRTALQQARQRVSGCDFQHLDEHNLRPGSAAFLFSHHVLEHVRDLNSTWESMSRLMADHSMMLHILPCADPGSFEHQLCLLRTDGIDQQRDGRFFYEDPAHLRRLTTRQLTELAAQSGFTLLRAWYSHHDFEAVDYLTGNGVRFVLDLCDRRKAVDAHARRKLRAHRRRLLFMAGVKGIARRNSPWLIPIAVPARRLTRRWTLRAQREWQISQSQSGGSEMYLLFERT